MVVDLLQKIVATIGHHVHEEIVRQNIYEDIIEALHSAADGSMKMDTKEVVELDKDFAVAWSNCFPDEMTVIFDPDDGEEE